MRYGAPGRHDFTLAALKEWRDELLRDSRDASISGAAAATLDRRCSFLAFIYFT